MVRSFVYTVALVLAGAIASAPLSAQAKKSDAMVKATAQADKPGADGKQTITLTLEIEPGWHAYANPLPDPDFPGKVTKVAVVGNVKPEDVKIDYPKGKVVKDKVLGDYRVYEGKETIKIQVQGAKGALSLRVELQTCNDKTCLLPATMDVSVGEP